MSPVYAIDVFEHIGDMKPDNSHGIVESLLVEMFICSALDFPLSWRRCRTFRGGAGELRAIFYLEYHSEINNRWRVIPSMALYVTTIDTYNTGHISSFMHRVWM